MIRLYQLASIPIHAHVQKQMDVSLKARGKHIDIQDANFVYLSDSAYIVEPVSKTVELTLFHNGVLSGTQQATYLKSYIGHIVDAIGYVNVMGEKGSCCGGRNICACESCCRHCCCLVWWHNFVRIDSIDITETTHRDIATVKLTFTQQSPMWTPINPMTWRYTLTMYNEFSTAPEQNTHVVPSTLVNIPPTCRSFANPCGSFTRVQFQDCDVYTNPIYWNEAYCSDYSDLTCRDFKVGGGIGWWRVSDRGDGHSIHVNHAIFSAPSQVTYQFKDFGTTGRIRVRNQHPAAIKEQVDDMYIDLELVADIATRNSVTIHQNDVLVVGEACDGLAFIRDNATDNTILYVGSAIRRGNNFVGQFTPGLNFVSVTPIEGADNFQYSILYVNRAY